MDAVRSILFNFLFYVIWTPLVCTLTLPSLLLPRRFAVMVAKFYQDGAYILQKYILGLDFEIRGLENKPADDTCYLVASKHFSAWETLQIFRLFKDATIILKKELLYLPLFGWFLKKLDVIALDRAKRTSALLSLYSGARKMVGQRRPIVIFPQGTRVYLHETIHDRPYKSGIIKLYSEIGLPILPVAINSGVYWPKNSFWKKSGKIIVEFLPVIPAGLPADDVMKQLEDQIETASNKLVTEAEERLFR
jgi:1-acyl-sn-glycerol-3-phosphate acyltransferase